MAYAAFILILLSSVAFFNYHAILSDQAVRALFYLSALGGIFVAWLKARGGERTAEYPHKAYFLLMVGIFISVFMSSLYHPQSLMVSVMTSLPVIFAYGTLWAYFYFDIPISKVMKAYMVLAVISSIVYFCNMATFPNNIFGEPMLDLDETRGMIRIKLPFVEMFPVLIFYVINRWHDDKKAKWVLIGAFLFLMVVLSVIRQVILYTALLSLIFILKKVSWKVKAGICAGVLAVVVFVLPMIPIYQAMVELSEDQVEQNEAEEENIRITAWRYYTYDNQTGALTPIFGNGTASLGNSIWGIAFDAETEENGCFAEDVGWAGFYWHYGIIALIGLLWLMIDALKRKKAQSMQFINYALALFFILPVASGPILYYYQIVNLAMLLYMAYACPQGDQVAERAKEMPEPERPGILPRFPQLR